MNTKINVLFANIEKPSWLAENNDTKKLTTNEKLTKEQNKQTEIITKDTTQKLNTLKDGFEKRKEVMKLKDKVFDKIKGLSQEVSTLNIPDKIKQMVSVENIEPKFDEYINQIENTDDILKALNGIDNILIKVEIIINKVKNNPNNISFNEITWLKNYMKEQFDEITWFVSIENKERLQNILILIINTITMIASAITAALFLDAAWVWILVWGGIWMFLWMFLWLFLSIKSFWIVTSDLTEETIKNYILDTLDDEIKDKYIDKKDFNRLYDYIKNKNDLDYETSSTVETKFWILETKLLNNIMNYSKKYGDIKSKEDFKKFVDYIISIY